MTRQNAHVFCPPPVALGDGWSSLGSFYTFATGKERKNDRQDPVHLCVGGADGIFNYLDSSLTDTYETHACFAGSLTQNDHPLHQLRWFPSPKGRNTRPRLDKCFTLSCRPRRKGGVGKAVIFPSTMGRNRELFV